MERLLAVGEDELLDQLWVGEEGVDEQAFNGNQGARGLGVGGAGLLGRAEEELAGGLCCCSTIKVSLDESIQHIEILNQLPRQLIHKPPKQPLYPVLTALIKPDHTFPLAFGQLRHNLRKPNKRRHEHQLQITFDHQKQAILTFLPHLHLAFELLDVQFV